MNRTIMEKVRCLLNESGLDESFWAEAAATASYLINRSPASAIDHNIPEELWLKRKPCYKHLRKFGSVAYVHQDQGKLKPRALKGIFIGYPTGTKGYKVWLLDEEKCVISRNVMFHEDVVFKDLNEKSEVITHDEKGYKVVTEVRPAKVTENRISDQSGVTHIEIESESDESQEAIVET